MPLIPTFRRQNQVDISEFKATLLYRVSSRTARAIQRNLALSNQKPMQQTKPKSSFQVLPSHLLSTSWRYFFFITHEVQFVLPTKNRHGGTHKSIISYYISYDWRKLTLTPGSYQPPIAAQLVVGAHKPLTSPCRHVDWFNHLQVFLFRQIQLLWLPKYNSFVIFWRHYFIPDICLLKHPYTNFCDVSWAFWGSVVI